MSGVNLPPIFGTKEEAQWYERIPKRVLFAIARDYAMIAVGEQEAEDDPALVLDELKRTAAIVADAGLDGG